VEALNLTCRDLSEIAKGGIAEDLCEEVNSLILIEKLMLSPFAES
jgi:hypothetical protein